MANPSPIYQVTYDGVQLPGYVQNEDRPVVIKSADNEIAGRDGFTATAFRTGARQAALTFLVKSELGSATELEHLENCKDQWRTALKILTRNPGFKQLRIHDSDRYYLAKPEGSSMPLEAGRGRSITYDVDFSMQPWAIAVSPATTSFTGNGGINLAIGDSRRTYPIFTIPAGVTAFSATDENSKVMSFLRGANTGTITIDCGAMTATNASGVSAVTSLVNAGFGLHYKGSDGNYAITITGFTGSGTVNVEMYARYEL